MSTATTATPGQPQPLDTRLASLLSAAQTLSEAGQPITVRNLARHLGWSDTTTSEVRRKLIQAGSWPYGEPKPPRGPMISYSPKVKASRRGKAKTPRKTGKGVGRWPRLDRERIERELDEWREKAGARLHPAY